MIALIASIGKPQQVTLPKLPLLGLGERIPSVGMPFVAPTGKLFPNISAIVAQVPLIRRVVRIMLCDNLKVTAGNVVTKPRQKFFRITLRFDQES